MGEAIYRGVSAFGLVFIGMTIWLYGVLASTRSDSQYSWTSGDAEAAVLIDPTSERDSEQAKRNGFFDARLSPSATCPVAFASPAHIDRTIEPIRELLLTEVRAEQAALADIRAGTAKLYISWPGAGPVTCSLASSMKERGVQVSLLGTFPKHDYSEFYIKRYNETVMSIM